MSVEYKHLRLWPVKKWRNPAEYFTGIALELSDTLEKLLKGETHEQNAID